MNKKIKLLFTSSRPLSWVNTAFPFAATYLYFTQSVDAILIIGTLFFLVPYNLLMYGVNDVYDYESDLRNPRKGGIEGAVVKKEFHTFLLAWSSLLPIPFIIILGILSPAPSANFVLAACLFFVIAYSIKGLRFKEMPVLDSVTSSLHFVGPALYAMSLVGWPTEAWPAIIAFFFWGIASQSLGAIQDIISDRAAKLRSIATVLGARLTLIFSLISYGIAIEIIGNTGPYGIVVGITGLLYIVNLLPHLTVTDKTSERTRAAWKRFLLLNYICGAVVTIVLILQFI